MKNFIKICRLQQKHLIKFLNNKLKFSYGNKNVVKTSDYIFAYGDIPVCVVAHLDTVHASPPKRFYSDVERPFLITSPEGIGGDDRCGVYIILELINRGLRPHVLFTTDEEVGGIGAEMFTKTFDENYIKDNINFFLEFDRKGFKDVVRYEDDNDELIREIEKFGFKEDYGSFSDISILSPYYKISSVNLSSGYYNAHTKNEYVNINEMRKIIDIGYKILTSNIINKKYEYFESISKYSFYNKYIFDKNFEYRDVCDCCGELKDRVKYVGGYFYCDECLGYFETNDKDKINDNEEYDDLDVCPDCRELYSKSYLLETGRCDVCGAWLDEYYNREEMEADYYETKKLC